ncbi:hypothetical protein MNVM_08740 [Mycobacterium novum]|uniref:Uncharacterized protein n=1 Tax=Mycobacterium novum TaxID=2492438 RepID=A0A7I7JJ59_9MYCO|nr:hypothetical protein MNVM_08740 [Mycobacterium novum]
MVEDARELELAVQPRLLVARAMHFVENFQRHRRGLAGPEARVVRSVDGGVPPAPDFVVDHVAAEVDAGFAHGPRLWGRRPLRRLKPGTAEKAKKNMIA